MSQRSWAWLGNFSKGLCICIYIYLGMNSCCVRPWKAAHFLFFQRLLIKHSLQPNFNTSEVGLTVNRYLTEKARNLHFCFRAGSQISNLNANLGKPCLWKPGRQWMFCQSWKHAPLLAWLKGFAIFSIVSLAPTCTTRPQTIDWCQQLQYLRLCIILCK